MVEVTAPTTTEWFKIRSVGDRVWAIDDHGSDLIYLASGTERCLLIDTGYGVGDLPGLVASMTSLPLLVVNTHGHPDHTWGNGAFSEVHVTQADEPFVCTPPTTEGRPWTMDTILPKPLPPDFDFETWVTLAAGSLALIDDGYVFDLGERVLQAVAVPGHTPGCICLLDRQARLMFTGDTVLPGTVWLHLPESLPLSEYHRNLRRLQGFSDAFDHILPAHGDLSALPLPKSVLDELVNGIELILAGKLVGYQKTTFAGDGLCCDFESCGIVYRPDRF